MDQRGLAPNTDGWYLIANHGAMVVRVRPGMPLGETESGELSFDPACAQLRLEIAEDGGLVLNAVDDHQLETASGDRCRREHLGRQRGAEIQLPHNILQLDTDFVERAPAGEILQFRAIPANAADHDPGPEGSRPPEPAVPRNDGPEPAASAPGAADEKAPRPIHPGSPVGAPGGRRDPGKAARSGNRQRLETRSGIPLPRRGTAPERTPPATTAGPTPAPRHGGPIAPPVVESRAPAAEPEPTPLATPQTPARASAPARDGRAAAPNRWIVGARLASLIGLSVIVAIWYLATRESPSEPTVTVTDPAPAGAIGQARDADPAAPSDRADADPTDVPAPALAVEDPGPQEAPPVIEFIAPPAVERRSPPVIAQAPAPDIDPAGGAVEESVGQIAADTAAQTTGATAAGQSPGRGTEAAAAVAAATATTLPAAQTPAAPTPAAPAVQTAAEPDPIAASETTETQTAPPVAEEVAEEAAPEPAPAGPDPQLVARLEAIGAAAQSQADALAQRRDLAAARLARRQGRLMAPEENSAYALYSRVLERDPDSVEARTGLQAVRQGLINQALAQLAGNALNEARATLQAAASAGANPMLVADLLGEVNARQRVVEAQNEESEPLYPVDQLVPVTMDPPSVPRGATGAGDVAIEVRFTVTEAGAVSDVDVLDAPPEPLAQAVQTAVSEWRFEPVLDNGQPVPVRSSVRFTFQN